MLLENHKSPEPKVTIHVVRPTDKQFTIYLCKTEKKQNILTLEAGQGRPVENWQLTCGLSTSDGY